MKAPKWRLGRWYLGVEFVPASWMLGVYVNTHLVGTFVTAYVPMLRLIAWRRPAT